MHVAQVLCAGSFAGAEAVATRLALALRDHVATSVVYVVRELRAGKAGCDQLLEQVRATGIATRVFDVQSRYSGGLLRQLGAALKEDRIDVLHSHAYKIATQVPLLRRRTRLPATVFTVHGFDQPHLRGRLFLYTVNAAGAYANDRLVCVSGPLAEHYRRYPGLERRLQLIGNAAPPTEASTWDQVVARRRAAHIRLAAAQGLDASVVWLLAVGRLVPVKNFSLLLEALALLSADGAMKLGLIVVGDGPLRAELEARSTRARLRVHFTGSVADVTPYYDACAALVLSSDSEGSPMVVFEALARGLPVVARAVGGVGLIARDGQEGLLVKQGDASALAAAIRRLISDTTLQSTLGRQAWERASTDLSADQWARRHLSVYESALGSQRQC